eukprot:TRINITY_DN73923_c0_g1_i1.p2 TRINITY_DN73923_c0_g1~~TRINITY_DN73923_c0_g1_i1.p2  ORF type:complete len:138 (+),score=17.17 TRINITY_DN73923_c0_g1_i1:40-414(+)
MATNPPCSTGTTASATICASAAPTSLESGVRAREVSLAAITNTQVHDQPTAADHLLQSTKGCMAITSRDCHDSVAPGTWLHDAATQTSDVCSHLQSTRLDVNAPPFLPGQSVEVNSEQTLERIF